MNRTIVETTELSFDDCIVKKEFFDADRINYLLNNPDIPKIVKNQLQKLYKRKQNLNQVEVIYQLGIKSKTFEEGGRLIIGKGGIGLQSLPRDVRNFLAEKFYWDIDIKNAQPTILWQYCEKQGWKCDNIKKFCNDRDTIIEEMVNTLGLNRSEAKDRLVALFFGSENVDGLSDFIRNSLFPELKLIRTNMFNNNQKLSVKLIKRPNPSASVMAMILQTEERKCLMKINEACSLKGRFLDVLIHDGGFIRKEKDETCFPKDLLKYFENYVKEKLGYSLEIIQKPIESSIVIEEFSNIIDNNILINDLYAAEQFVKLMNGDIIYDDKQLYIYKDGIWSDNLELLNTTISEFKDKLVFRQIVGNGIISKNDYSGNVKNRENLKKMIPSVLEKHENFLLKGREKSTGKILFKNGIYDFKTDTLEDFDRNIVFSSMIPFDFPTKDIEKDISFVNKVFFEDAFNNEEVPKIFRHFLMRGIIGDYQMKKFLTCIGPTNCSKGMLQEFMRNIFSNGNIGTFNCNSLISRKNTEGTRDLGWFADLINTRICFGSEIKADKECKIDSEMIKQIVSGGETIVLRRLYKEEQVVISRTMPILLVNEISSFTSMNDAIKNRLIPIQYNYSFVEKVEKSYHKPSDPELKNTLKNEKYYFAMIRLLIREYKNWQSNNFKVLDLPESMTDFKDDIIPSLDIEEELEGLFIITKNHEDYITIKDLENGLKNKDSKVYKNTASTELQRIGCKAIRKSIDTKQVRVITGIKKVE